MRSISMCVLAMLSACSGRSSSDDPATTPAEDVVAAADPGTPADTGGGPTDTVTPDVADTALPDADATAADAADATDAKDTKDTKDAGKPDTISEDAGPTGPFTWVKISDSLDNDSIKFCDPFKSPGADIDAVELYRDGKLLGYATQVVSDIDKDPFQHGSVCESKYQDAEVALGAQDAKFEGGSVSLNGGSILLQLADGEAILPQDELRVYEAGASVIGVPEAYSVSIGEKGLASGEWIEIAKKVEGNAVITVSF